MTNRRRNPLSKLIGVPLSDINLILTTWFGLGTSHRVFNTPFSFSTMSFFVVSRAVSLPDAKAVSQNLQKRFSTQMTYFNQLSLKMNKYQTLIVTWKASPNASACQVTSELRTGVTRRCQITASRPLSTSLIWWFSIYGNLRSRIIT